MIQMEMLDRREVIQVLETGLFRVVAAVALRLAQELRLLAEGVDQQHAGLRQIFNLDHQL